MFGNQQNNPNQNQNNQNVPPQTSFFTGTNPNQDWKQ